MRVVRKEDIFNKYIIDWCQEHNEPIVEPLMNDSSEPVREFCLRCLGKKEISLTEFSELIKKWEKMILDYLKRMMFNEDNQIAVDEMIKELFEFRNKSFGVFGEDVEKSSENEFISKIEIDPFKYATYLLNLVSSKELQDEKIYRVIQQKGIPSPETYQREKLEAAVELLFDFKYSEHLVENGMRKVVLISLEDRFKNNNDFYKFLITNDLFFEKDGDRFWYEAFDLPVMEKIDIMMKYYGGYNKEYLEGENLIKDRLLPVWPTAIEELKKNSIDQKINDFTDDEKLMLSIAHNWYPVISPTNFHANQFDTSFLVTMDHNDIYKLFKFLRFISRNRNKRGIFAYAIEDLEADLEKNGMDHLLEELLSKMVIYYPILAIPEYYTPNLLKKIKHLLNLGRYLLTAKDIHEKIKQELNIKGGQWSDKKVPLGYHFSATRDGKKVDAIVFDYKVLVFYASVKMLYNRDKVNKITNEDGEFFENQIVPFYFRKNGYDYIKSEIITEGIKKIPDVSYMDIEIDGILIDKKNRNIFVVEVKSITPRYSDVVSRGTISVMAMRFLVELTGDKIKKIKDDSIIIESKTNNPTMERRTELVKENWEEMDLMNDSINIENFDFKPMIITNVPVPISEKTILELGYPVVSLYDIMHELPQLLDKYK